MLAPIAKLQEDKAEAEKRPYDHDEHDEDDPESAQGNINALGRLLRGASIVSQTDLSTIDPYRTGLAEHHHDYDSDAESDSDDDEAYHDDLRREQEEQLKARAAPTIQAEHWKKTAYGNIASSASHEKGQEELDFNREQRQAVDEAAEEQQQHSPSSTQRTLDDESQRKGRDDAHLLDPNKLRTSTTERDEDAQNDDEYHKTGSVAKLRALQEEFGSIPQSHPDCPEERLISDSPGLLIRDVGIFGTLLLTSRRLCFLALLPSEHPEDADAEDPASAAPHDPKEHDPVIRSGPGVLHHHPRLRPRRTCWIELRRSSLTFYKSSRKLYKPIKSIRLDQVNRVLPQDYSKPKRLQLVGPSLFTIIDLGTEESALQWRKEIEGACFNFNNKSDRIRISLPLERILHTEVAQYPNLAKVLHLDVLDDHSDAKRLKKTAEPDATDLVDEHGDPGATRVNFALLNKNAMLISDVNNALLAYREWTRDVGHEKLNRDAPRAILEFDEARRGDSYDAKRSHDSAHPEHGQGAGQDLASAICTEFGLPKEPEKLKVFKASLVKTLPSPGQLAIGLDVLCFWKRPVMTISRYDEIKLKIPLAHIVGVETYRAFRWHHHGLTVHVRAHPDIYFDFTHRADRKAVMDILAQSAAANGKAADLGRAIIEEQNQQGHGRDSSLSAATSRLAANFPTGTPVFPAEALNFFPKVVNVPKTTIAIPPQRFYCLTIGSRGDVQPYIALCMELKKHGHHTVIVSHDEYRGWVEGHGIEFRAAGGDPAALMKLSVEHRIFSPAFFKESIGKFRVWLDELLRESWEQCQGADVLIESPSTMAGIHVAEGLGIPYFRAFTMPWSKTSQYPQAFSVPSFDLGPSYNSSSYAIFDSVLWTATAGQINRWRKYMLGIPPTTMAKLNPDKVPFVYNFSPAVVPVPNDWDDRICVSGYWFLDTESSEWTPPDDLRKFLDEAKKDEKKIAYIGFGSIPIPNHREVMHNIYEAVKEAGIRAIVAKGWSSRGSEDDEGANDKGAAAEGKTEAEIAEALAKEYPDCYLVDSIPHDWLFPQIDLAMHHGGAGTTGASLRAGLVTLIKPFFGDQFFWAQRVDKLGAGVKVSGLSQSALADALKSASQDRIMIEKAKEVGERIREENGVANAVRFIYVNLGLARKRTVASKADAEHDGSYGVKSHTTPLVEDGPAAAAGTTGVTDSGKTNGGNRGGFCGTKHTSPNNEAARKNLHLPTLSFSSGMSSFATGVPSPDAADSKILKDHGGNAAEMTEEERMAALKGYKNAKAEDIRRRAALEERLAREKLEKEEEEQQDKDTPSNAA